MFSVCRIELRDRARLTEASAVVVLCASHCTCIRVRTPSCVAHSRHGRALLHTLFFGQVKTAYYKMSLRYHPDHNPDCDASADKYRAVAAAYEVLGQAHLRARYDSHFVDGQRAGAGTTYDPRMEEYRRRAGAFHSDRSQYDFQMWYTEHYGEARYVAQADLCLGSSRGGVSVGPRLKTSTSRAFVASPCQTFVLSRTSFSTSATLLCTLFVLRAS